MPKEVWFPASALSKLFAAAGMDREQRRRFLLELAKHLPRRGPKPIDDDALISRAAELLRAGAPTPHAACVEATKHLPEWQRKTVSKRIYKRREQIKALAKETPKIVPSIPPTFR
jgi:hypothetical protein